MRCRQCGSPATGEYCAQCAVWFSPVEADPYATLPRVEPLVMAEPPRPTRGKVAIPVTLGVVALAAVVGLSLLFLGGDKSPEAAQPAAPPSASSAPARTPTPDPKPTPQPTVVVTVTQSAPAPTPVTEEVEGVDEVDPRPDAIEPTFDRYYPLYRGDAGYVVSALQGLLNASGVRTYVDGDFGSATERSVRQWQAKQGLSATGTVDDTTWASLTPKLTNGSSGDKVKVLQNVLVSRGYSVVVDGKFGDQTERAVRAFQSDRGITVDGVVGQETWPALLA